MKYLPKIHQPRLLFPGLIQLLLLALPCLSHAQEIESQSLSAKIYRGAGVINLLNDISANSLANYFNQTGGLLMLGADVNENASGNESNPSVGVAIKQAQLSIRTTAGDFTFKDFFTSTSAMLRESGSTTALEYSTLFGQGGSSQITGTGSLDIAKFDDVMWFKNVAFNGSITSATLSITFLPTPNQNATAAESFFDFSGGFEEFALFNAADAALVEAGNIGMADAPSDIKYETQSGVAGAIAQAAPAVPPSTSTKSGASTGLPADSSSMTPVSAPPAAPAPPLVALASMGCLLLWKNRKQPTAKNA